MAEMSALTKQGVAVHGGQFVLKVSRDTLGAILFPKENLGIEEADLNQLKREAGENGIKFGLLENPKPLEDGSYLIARGKPPVAGEDAKVKMHVRPAVTFTPKAGRDAKGKVDLRELQNIVNVTKDLLLLEKISPTTGEPGTNVFGSEMPPKPGKDRKLKIGKGVYLSDDETKVFAQIDGKFIMEDGKPSVYEEHIVGGDVDMGVGNIAFGGKSLSISGEVHSGFIIKCRGHIEILKGVNSASVMAGGNLTVSGGVIGPNAVLKAKGDIRVDFMENNCVVDTLGNLITTDFLVQCKGKIGKDFISPLRGGVIGGSFIVGGSMYTFDLGSDAEVSTEIGVGMKPSILRKKKEAEQDFLKWSDKLNETIKNISGLEKIKKETGEEFPPDRMENLRKYKEAMPKLMEKVDILKALNEEIQDKLDQMVNESVFVYGTLYPGVTIKIGKGIRLISAAEEKVVAYFDKTSQQILVRKMTSEELEMAERIAAGKKDEPA